MAFNNGLERKRFEAKQKALRAEYERLGMSVEQIQKMYEYDLADFNSNRKYITHTQSLSDIPFPEDGENGDEAKSTLFDKFLRELSTNIGSLSELSRYGWIDEIDDSALAVKLKKLPPNDLELLTLLAFDEHTQEEAAAIMGISDRTVRRKLVAWKSFLKNF